MSDLGAVLVFLGILFGAAVLICTIMLLVQTFTILSLAKKWMRVRITSETIKLQIREATETELHPRY